MGRLIEMKTYYGKGELILFFTICRLGSLIKKYSSTGVVIRERALKERNLIELLGHL